jgi:hypothetical protein
LIAQLTLTPNRRAASRRECPAATWVVTDRIAGGHTVPRVLGDVSTLIRVLPLCTSNRVSFAPPPCARDTHKVSLPAIDAAMRSRSSDGSGNRAELPRTAHALCQIYYRSIAC